MSLSIGIVGLPNVGKSTLFKAITKKAVEAKNYPFCTIDPNVGVVKVLDKRVDKLAKLNQSAKKIYPTVEFVDIAGLVKGASCGEGLGNQFLANIKQVDAVLYVLRGFQQENIINTQTDINIIRDKEILETELSLKDLEVVEKKLQSLEKELKSQSKEVKKEYQVLQKARQILAAGKMLISQSWTQQEQDFLKKYQFLTLKPKLYLLNGKETEIKQETVKIFKEHNWPYLIMDILSQADAAELSRKERAEFGLPQDLDLDNLIKTSYQLLDLITFFTTGPKETHAWTLKRGSLAPQAGGVIHSDFQEYFIRAEVISFKDLIKSGGYQKAKELGLVRTVGKDYLVKDGDVIEIKFSA